MSHGSEGPGAASPMGPSGREPGVGRAPSLSATARRGDSLRDLESTASPVPLFPPSPSRAPLAFSALDPAPVASVPSRVFWTGEDDPSSGRSQTPRRDSGSEESSGATARARPLSFPPIGLAGGSASSGVASELGPARRSARSMDLGLVAGTASPGPSFAATASSTASSSLSLPPAALPGVGDARVRYDAAAAWVDVNVGGTRFRTTHETLVRERESVLARIALGEAPVLRDETGAIFLDRDPTHFHYVLNWLRDGEVDLPEDLHLLSQLLREATYYQLAGLVRRVDSKRRRVANRPMARDMVLQLVHAAGASGAAVQLPATKMSGLVLSFLRLPEANLSGAEFNNAVLQGVVLDRAILTSASLKQTDLTGASLVGARCEGVDFSQAVLRRAQLASTDLRGAIFRGADLARVNLQNASLKGAVFEGASLHKTTLIGLDLRGMDLSGLDLTESNLEGAQLQGANLARSDLRKANLYGANLAGANLAGANLRGAIVENAVLDRVEGEFLR